MIRTPRSPRFTHLASLVLLLAFAVRVPFLTGDRRLHADEAYFAAFARNAVLYGDWMLPGDLDKPPLAIYAMAFSMALFAAHPMPSGVLDMSVYAGEMAVRLPGLLAAVVTVGALTGAARRLYRSQGAALWSGVLLALSPIGIVFGATGFTDGLMLMGGALALRAAAGGAPGWTGVWLGAAIAAKPQGVFFIPFALIVLWSQGELRLIGLARLGTAIALWGVGLVGWDAARGAVTPFYALGAANNPLAPFAPPEAIIARATRWLGYIGTWLGWALPLLTYAAWRGRTRSAKPVVERFRARGRDRSRPYRSCRRRDNACILRWTTFSLWLRRSPNAWLLLTIIGYLLLHVLGGVAVYDRYALIPLIPTCLLLGQGGTWLGRRPLLLGLAGLALVWGVIDAHGERLPVGGDGGDGRYGVMEGIDRLAGWTDALPTASVVYNPWLGWHMRFYRSAWADERFVHYPTPDALAPGAAALDERGVRWLIAPRSTDLHEWVIALETRGFAARLETYIGNFAVLRLEPP
jgi:hypothetical protein